MKYHAIANILICNYGSTARSFIHIYKIFYTSRRNRIFVCFSYITKYPSGAQYLLQYQILNFASKKRTPGIPIEGVAKATVFFNII